MSLYWILNERKRAMDYRTIRDEGLVERGARFGLQWGLKASKVKTTRGWTWTSYVQVAYQRN